MQGFSRAVLGFRGLLRFFFGGGGGGGGGVVRGFWELIKGLFRVLNQV